MSRHRSCPWCRQSFELHPRLGKRQKCCGGADCKRKQKNSSHLRWKTAHSDFYRANQKDWRLSHPDYWRDYRASHPDYVERNRAQARARKALSLGMIGLQKRIDILQLNEINCRFWTISRFAKSPQSLVPLLFAKSMIQTSSIYGGAHAEKYRPQTTP